MIIAIELESIGQGLGDSVVWQCQIGVTRVGRGGRCQPRCRSGAMASVSGIVASEAEPRELEARPNPAPRHAPLARAVVFLAIGVVACWTRAVSILHAVGRVVIAALLGRPGRVYRQRAPWRAVWRGETDGWY